MIKVAGYCRVSTDKGDQSNSFASQQRFFREYIACQPQWELYDIYADEGITGTNTKKRVEFQRMIRDAYAGEFQLILTKEISRFSRNILDTISYTRKLKAIGVGVIFLTENLNTLNPETELLMTFMGTLAQEESRKTSMRVKWGQTRRMEQGVVFGNSLLGYRVINGKIAVDPEGAALVRLIFHKYGMEKKGSSTICSELQQAGYHTPTGSTKWNASYILKILKNEKYIGDLVQKKSYTPDYLTHSKKTNHGEEPLVVIHNHHEPIISKELWDIVQKERCRRNKHSSCRGHSNRYPFSGKIHCGECGASFVVRHKKCKNGTDQRRWICYRVVSQGAATCNVGKIIRDDDLQNMLKIALQSLPLDIDGILKDLAEIIAEVLRKGKEGISDNPEKQKMKIKQLEIKRLKLMDAYFAGEISETDYHAVRLQYDQQLTRLRDFHTRSKGSLSDFTDLTIKLQKELASILSAEIESNIFCKTILDSVTVFRDRHIELVLKDLSHIFRFCE